MKCFLFFFAFLLIKCDASYSQVFDKNTCDSTILSKSEYLKCIQDSAWSYDIQPKVNYIVFTKTLLHPKYRILRKSIEIPQNISFDLNKLKSIYDSTLYYKIKIILKDLNRNLLYVQPQAYLSTMLSLENFKFYPEVYAILIADIHLMVTPKTTPNQLLDYKNLVEKIYSQLNPEYIQKIELISSNMRTEKINYTKGYFLEMFQGALSDTERKKYDLINFLLWKE